MAAPVSGPLTTVPGGSCGLRHKERRKERRKRGEQEEKERGMRGEKGEREEQGEKERFVMRALCSPCCGTPVMTVRV